MRFMRLLLLPLLVGSAIASAANWQSLLELEARPTSEQVEPYVAEILKDIKLHTLRIPDPGSQNLSMDVWTQRLITAAPRMIAGVESTYPGATFVFIGRDCAPWADAFEAFYRSIDQGNDRVLHLGMSSPTLQTATDEKLLGMMRTAGVDVDHLADQQGLVFVDTVSSGGGTQGRRLMSVLFGHYMKSGGDPLELIGKVNMVGLEVSTFKGQSFPFHLRRLQEYLTALIFTDGSNSRAEGLIDKNRANLFQVLTYPEPMQHRSNESGYAHFLGWWHLGYGELIEAEDGATYARRGDPSSRELRSAILLSQAKIIKAAQSPIFFDDVYAHARVFGFTFPRERPKPIKVDLQGLKKFRKRLSERTTGAVEAQVFRTLPDLLKNVTLSPALRSAFFARYGGYLRAMTLNGLMAPVPENSMAADVLELQNALYPNSCERDLEEKQ